uniref:Glycosyl transferase, family 2 n=1 Tax=Rhodopseudomonas palustris (strain BisA53) TaxID=316055 RepID=Q07SN4_RHOP5
MALVFEYLLCGLGIVLFCCALTFLVEIIAGAFELLRSDRDKPELPLRRARLAVLVPAHNESKGILPTIRDILSQLSVGDRLLVIADNCSDDTASVAADAGAEVVRRNDPTRIGKGYAIDFGICNLRESPPEVLVIIDADCRIAEGTLSVLSQQCVRSDRPVQSLYLMFRPAGTLSIHYQLAEFAWRIKNWGRPLGLSALGLPCQLMGTGMAFPWNVIESAELASGSIVEDMKLGLDLAVSGKAALFCPAALVTSEFPSSQAAAQQQRRRWEHGHIGLIRTAPALLWLGATRRNIELVALALDLAIPPLVLLGVMLMTITIISAGSVLFGFTPKATLIAAAGLMVYLTALVISWWRWGRDLLTLRSLGQLAPYALARLKSYARLISRGATAEWIRTERDEKP